MFKRSLIILSAAALALCSMESCFLQKNRCDSCPSHTHHKKVRHSSKGSR